MTDKLNFEVYLSISKKKFGIYLLDKINLKNIKVVDARIKNQIILND